MNEFGEQSDKKIVVGDSTFEAIERNSFATYYVRIGIP